MGRSLFFKLLGAFALVIVVLAVVATALANQATAGEFRTYTARNGQVWAQWLAPALADYYAQNNTWEGVGGVVQAPMTWSQTAQMTPLVLVSSPPPPLPPTMTPLTQMTQTFLPPDPVATPQAAPGNAGMGHGGMGMGMGRGGMGMGSNGVQSPTPALTQPQNGSGSGSDPTSLAGHRGMGPGMPGWNGSDGAASGNMWSMMGHRVIIADATGRVVSDSSDESHDTVLSPELLSGGAPIRVSGQPAGTVLVEASDTLPGTPADEFLRATNRSILVAVGAAGAVAMTMGSVLFFQITAPVRKLKAAAQAIATGDLSQRVQVQTRDELGDLAMTFNYMAESLSRAESQRRQMVADVAHELRTPLSVMQANLEAMQDGVLPLDAEEIASLHEETVLLSRLVADLHLLSMAEAGQLKLERVEVEPGELVRRAAERLNHSTQERGVTLLIETSPALPPVRADADRISQVVGNLISNSLRYTGSGGSITVKAEARSGQHPANSPQRVAEVLVSVTDTGSGIPEADLPHIFDRFYRADKSRTRASGGSGLGLAIVKYIVEAHGGKIWAESPVRNVVHPESRGTRISFTLPTVALTRTIG